MPASGSPTKPSRGASAVIRPGAVEPYGGVVGSISASQLLEARREALVQHRAVEHVLHRVADRGRAQALVEPAHELVVHVVVDDRGAERGAALPRGAEAGEQRALDGEVEVGVLHHDHRVLAAQLQARRLQVAAAQRADLRPDGRRAGEPDLVDEAAARARARAPRTSPGRRRGRG